MSNLVTAVSPIPPLQPAVTAGPTTDPETAAVNRVVAAAAKILNDSGAAGNSHEFSIAIDPATRQAVVRIIDRSTQEVVEQIPTEYLLRIARQLSERTAQQSVQTADKTSSQ